MVMCKTGVCGLNRKYDSNLKVCTECFDEKGSEE